ncbi:hypothetical protein GCM10011489_38080 [Gordonia jinhuaensis]|uniref:Uncharacterized protein n=1 Tax=Gordonia jinhuaensis TaxID=1517702 RepID=A0A916TIV9_9ACTN|nr:hypothetical protein GCM10011489_38080 [Gordonia jinhuaensis]
MTGSAVGSVRRGQRAVGLSIPDIDTTREYLSRLLLAIITACAPDIDNPINVRLKNPRDVMYAGRLPVSTLSHRYGVLRPPDGAFQSA